MRGNKLTWFLGILVVLLTCALTLQTAYLVWLHRQLYLAVAGPNSGLGDLEKMLNTEVASVDKPSGRPSPEKREQLDLGGVEEKAQRIVGEALKDPGLRDLLGNLGLEAPKEESKTFHPQFDFEEDSDRYVVTVDLPGWIKSEVSAAVDKGVLKVSGTHDGAAFRESFAFPGPIVVGSENISFRNGKLVVTATKRTHHPAGAGSAA